MRTAIYARVSTEDKGQDTENQLVQLREYCARKDWAVAEEYLDHVSGKTATRDGFKRLMSDASRRKFDVVLVWALDRFTREGIPETFEHLKKLTSYGVQFESFTEPHFRTMGPAGTLMLAIAAWIAEQERLRISERTKAGLERVRRAGVKLGRPKLVTNIDWLLEKRRAGCSIREIAQSLSISKTSAARLLSSAAASLRQDAGIP